MYVGSEVNPLGLDRTLANAPDSGRPSPAPGLAIWTNWKGPAYDWDKDATMVINELSPVLDDADPDLTAFRRRGGKLLLYTGWADPLIPAADLVNYYEGMQKKMGGASATAEFARLFMVPGMGHCAGGTSPNRFDALAALEPWVEKGTAPDKMIASQVAQGATVRTRPLWSVSAGREVERHRQFGRRGEFQLPAALSALQIGIADRFDSDPATSRINALIAPV